MRKSFLLTILTAFSLFFLSCSKDKEEVLIASEASVIGAWNLTALEATDGTIDLTVDGTTIPSTFEALGKDFDMVVTFSEEPKTITSEGTYTTVLTTTVMGETTTEEQPGEDFFEAETWRLDGNTLYFSNGTEEIGLTITALTDTTMSLSYEIDETVDFLGILTSVTATYTMTLTK